jgi:hypothetical protein
LSRDEFFHFRSYGSAFFVGGCTMQNQLKCIDRIAGNEYVKLYQIAFHIL